MKKSIINKALRDLNRLITGEYNGQDWYCPGGYFATTEPIYKDYKLKKDQYYIEQKPKLDEIFERLSDQYSTATDFQTAPPELNTTQLVYGNTGVLVNTAYFELFEDLGADRFDIADKLDPVKVYKSNKLIGLIMPLRS